MKIYSLKKASLPKVAVLATGLVGVVLVASIGPPAAQAFPSRARDCAGCHVAGGSTTATPSTLTPAAGAVYSVAITMAANPAGGLSGYAIVPVTAGTGAANGGNTSSVLFYSATMTAPAAAGVYRYNVFTNQGLTDPEGQASSASYTITVPAAPTTVPPTTVPPTSAPPVPSASVAVIRSLSPGHGVVGARVTIRGSGFGRTGSVKFGSVVAKASTWTRTSVVVRVRHVSVHDEADSDCCARLVPQPAERFGDGHTEGRYGLQRSELPTRHAKGRRRSGGGSHTARPSPLTGSG